MWPQPQRIAMQAEKMRLMREAYAETVRKLTSLKRGLVRIAEELYQEKELSGERVKAILQESAAEPAQEA
jgi:ATP-dependent Zn protease